MIKTKKPQSIQSKPKIKTSTVKGIKKQTIVLGKGGSKSKEVNKKKSISEVKKKESEGKDKKS